jgi:WD40 repeat protein
VRVWDAIAGAHKHTLTGHKDYICCVAFSPNGLHIILGSNDRTVRVWNVVMLGGLENTLAGFTDLVIAGSCLSDGPEATSMFDSQFVRVNTILCDWKSNNHLLEGRMVTWAIRLKYKVARFTCIWCRCEGMWSADVVMTIWELWLKFSYLVVDLSPGAQLAEALDVGMNKMDWLETSWSQALLLIHGELFTRQSPDEAI